MGERLKTNTHRLSRKAGAVMLGIGLALTQSEAPSSALVDYKLPAFDYEWNDDDHGILASVHYDQSLLGSLSDNRGLPETHVDAFNASLQNAVFLANRQRGNIQDIIIQKAESDNGQYDYRTGELKVFMSDGHMSLRNRIFFDDRALKALMVHESSHAGIEEWIQYFRANLNEPHPPAYLAQDVEEVRLARDELDKLYYSNLPEPCDASLGSAQTDCSMDRLNEYADRQFRCIDEGHALQDLIGTKDPLPIGHPFNGIYEATPSIITSTEMNPSYAPDCFDKNPSEFTTALRKLTKKLLSISFKTSPELEAALRRTTEKSDAVDRLLS